MGVSFVAFIEASTHLPLCLSACLLLWFCLLLPLPRLLLLLLLLAGC
jgi:hypothetical protein